MRIELDVRVIPQLYGSATDRPAPTVDGIPPSTPVMDWRDFTDDEQALMSRWRPLELIRTGRRAISARRPQRTPRFVPLGLAGDDVGLPSANGCDRVLKLSRGGATHGQEGPPERRCGQHVLEPSFAAPPNLGPEDPVVGLRPKELAADG